MKEIEENNKKVIEKIALQAANQYFDELITSIDRLKQEVVRFKEGFNSAQKGEKFAISGIQKTSKDMLNQIEWCANEVQQFSGLQREAVAAAAKIASAFEINYW